VSRRALAAFLALAAACASIGPTPPPPPAPPPRAGSASTAWWNGAVFYEVFVRSFRDSDGDGKGDLAGLLAKLDHLNDGRPGGDDLEVDGIWLMPVFASPSYHGYDTTDYETVQPDYGTNADLVRLVDAAHARGMKVIVDLVLNHTSDQHPWFVDAASGARSPRRDWYAWSPTDPGWTQPWDPYGGAATWHPRNGAYYYGLFWSGMPDLNYANPAVREEAKRLARLWLDRGVDGFRLDAARYLVETGPGPGQADTAETHAFWKEFAAAVRAAKPDVALVGEVWTDTPVIARYYGDTDALPGGDELPLLFDFPLASAMVAAVNAGDGAGIAAKLEEERQVYPVGAASAPFLTNHDQIRAATQLGNDRARLGLAAALLLTMPGTPFLYYGEEVGLQNGPGNADEAKRTPMPWDGSPGGGFTSGMPWFGFAPGQATANVAAQTADPGSLLSRYRALVRARHAAPALGRGDLALLTPRRGPAPVLAFVRTLSGETVLVAHNFSGAPATAGPFAVPGAAADAVFADPGAAATADASGWRVSLPARASGIWRLW
jgi:glycosidase